MISRVDILGLHGMQLDTQINPISLVASRRFDGIDKPCQLYTVHAPISVGEDSRPPNGSSFLSFLILPCPRPSQRIDVVNGLVVPWLDTQPFTLSPDFYVVNANIVRVFNGKVGLGPGLFFPLLLLKRPDITDDQTIEM